MRSTSETIIGHLKQAESLILSRKFTEALTPLRTVLEAEPENIDGHFMVGLSFSGQGKIMQAVQCYNNCLSIDKHHIPSLLELAEIFVKHEDYAKAEEALALLLHLGKHELPIQKHYAACKFSRDKYDEALMLYTAIEQEFPKDSHTWLQIGRINQVLGNFDKAVKKYIQCTHSEKQTVAGFWGLANLKRYQFTDGQIQQMQGLVSQANLSDADKSLMHFALARAFEDLKQTEKSVEHYLTANQMQHKIRPYQAVLFEQYVDKAIQNGQVTEGQCAEVDSSLPAPIFIVGLPRAGSTLTEQIIASHSKVEGTRELPYLSRMAFGLEKQGTYPTKMNEVDSESLTKLARQYLQMASDHRKTDRPFFIDKHPNNCLHIGLIYKLFPNAKIVEVRRDPMDNCISAFKQYFQFGQDFSFDLAAVGHYYAHYDRLMQHWYKVLPNNVFRLQYEDLLDSPESKISELIAFLGLEMEQGCVEFYDNKRPVNTPSAEQVRQPLYKTSMENWKPFEAHIGPLKESLGSLA